MQYLLGQPFVLTLWEEKPRVGIISSFTEQGYPRAKYIDDAGDLEEVMVAEKERSPLREACSEKVSPSKHRIYYGKLSKKNVKIAANIKLKSSEDEIREAIKVADVVYKAMSK